ncbi:YggS family pyridoxal phosphate-dependent enzyme [Cellulomonas sp. NPDC089187]|uniref:YggS family pyridoxal phosphate-dependent enzyme n=1 Tax=Cellulomonas sp. NPDC089187 TaxID=3154970 RepID=UPI00343842B4
MSIAENLARVRARIAAAESAAGREPGSVRLLLATKTQPIDLIRAAVEVDAAARATSAGTVHRVLLGENRVQELVAKAPDLTDLRAALHLIGPLQSNKVNAALRWATCVQSVDTAELAERLDRRCAATDRTLDVMIQVNVSGEPTKSGVSPQDAARLTEQVDALDRLRLRGLMTIGANSPDQSLVRRGFATLRELGERIGVSELSMGMSRDLELAVTEGATIVRVGSAVFGART